ncbi:MULTISPECIES: hypothetical protein [Streptomyces]|uniref:hypothetical protein n=1 Tax=Streptomyces TaxID=1883 RepID=UPI0037232400
MRWLLTPATCSGIAARGVCCPVPPEGRNAPHLAFADGPRLNDPGFGQDQDNDDAAREQYARRARQAHYEQEQRYRTRVHVAVSTAFRLADEHPEDSSLTGPLLPVRVKNDPDKPLLLEAATPESYLTLEPTDPVLSTAGRTA